MKKFCGCGASMELCLRTIVFKKKISVFNVPVWSCMHCGENQLFTAIQDDLLQTIDIRQGPIIQQAKTVPFQEHNEISRLLLSYAERESTESMAVLLEQRVNELLDLLLIATSLEEKVWVDEIQVRLRQVYACHVS